jgi:hypothetical protein
MTETKKVLESVKNILHIYSVLNVVEDTIFRS